MDGQFIGGDRYRQLLASQRPPVLPEQFENDVRRQILAEKLQALVTGWVHVSDAEVEREYRKRNEKVKLELAVFTAENFKKTIQPTDAELPDQPYVLVCPTTDPAWVPLFVRARALVMETGGVLSHGAIVAREFGLPAVAGLPDIHRRLRSGQKLRVDGGTGQVVLLS